MAPNIASIEAIFSKALEIPSAEARAAYLDRACAADPELRRQVESLIDVHDRAGRFLASPTVSFESGSPELVGSTIGPYKLMEQIGEGGMGVVYVAEQTQPVRRKVALKIIKPGMDTKQVIARFEAERQALAMMDHPNIAKVHDAGTTESGRPYFVMELVRGIPITDYCDRERLSIPERLELFVQVCRAVQHSHQKGIIHRDLKPSNILVTLHDGVPVPKVIDFGIAKATGQGLTERTIYTEFAQLVGTPLYMSPEQAELSGLDIDTRSDIYSLGVLLYELLTGTTPFDPATLKRAALDEMRRILREEEPPNPSTRLSSLGTARATVSANRQADARQLDHAVRGELDWIVMKALEKDRRRRYETANDFAADIMRHLTDQPVEACPPSAWYRFGKLARRNRVALVTSAVVATALVLGTAVSTGEAIRATGAERAALRHRQAADAAREAESSARRRAEAAESAARAEADTAKAINDFLIQDLLGQAQPSRNVVSQRLTLRVVLDRAADRVGARFRDRPLVEAALRCTLGETYGGLGANDRCRQQYAAARALYERELGPGAPETANAMVGLGTALRELGEHPRAEPLLRQAMDILLRARGVEHPDTLKAMMELSQACQYQGKSAEAGALAAEVLEVGGRILGPEDFLTLDAMAGLAESFLGQGKPSLAEPLALKALEVGLRVQGEYHPHTLWYMVVVGRLYEAQGKLPEAEGLYAKVWELGRRVVGEEHPALLWVRGLLLDLYEIQGKLSEAESLLLGQLEDQRRVKGKEHLSLLPTMSRLATIYQARGKQAQAEALWRDILAIQRRINRMSTLADSDQARQEAIAVGGPGDGYWNPNWNNMAWWLATCPIPQLREPAKAVELARRAVEKARPQHRGMFWNTLGVALYRAGDWKAAIEALGQSERLSPDKRVALNAFFLAMAHWRLGDRERARTWYDRAVAWMDKNRPRDQELARFRAEAASLLSLADLPADVFVRP
jgi:serine/threonine protein kinase